MLNSIENKKILIVIGGGIAAYKVLDVIRELRKNNCEVKTILTNSGKEFVTPLSISALSKNKVFENLFDPNNEGEMDHIALSRWCDLILVAPTTANLMANFAHGEAKDFATTVIMASNKPIFLAPAMNVEMWNNQATQENFQKLIQFKYKFIGPAVGEMACGEVGAGKMSSPEEIILTIKNYFLSKNLFNSKNLKALVTAGSTREYIDPVRFLSNESSGKQGFEIAKSLNDIGFKTKLVIGPNSLDIKNQENLEVINVTTAKQMFEACKDNLPVDVAVCTAAVSDFKVKNYNEEKIKKEGLEDFNLELEKNAAETKNIIENAQKKIQNKHCDWIVANNVADKSIGFNSDYNEVFLISKNKEVEKFNKTTKSEIAKKLSNKILHALIQ
jgi:phosphopantothenoylcysteine decarboxylase/phosphopantothenate--cysteine ligase